MLKKKMTIRKNVFVLNIASDANRLSECSNCYFSKVCYLSFNGNPTSVGRVLNTHYMRNSTIIYQFKMEYESKINIFGLKMIIKSGQEKKYFEILPSSKLFWKIFFTSQKGRFLHLVVNSVIKMTFFAQ